MNINEIMQFVVPHYGTTGPSSG